MKFLKRIFKLGFKTFKRNPESTTACVFVSVIVISLITSLFLFQAVSQFLISTVEEKVDVSIYFNENVSEDEIEELSENVSLMPEVESINYVSKEEALQNFKERHEGDIAIMESLEELGLNPFLASLNVRAFDPSDYEEIISSLTEKGYESSIYKVDYYEKKPILENLFSVKSQINRIGIILTISLGLIAILVAFNQIHLSLYTSKQEIGIMKMVGASNIFIKGPFIVQGIIIGGLSALITFFLFLVTILIFNSGIQSSLGGFNMLNFFTSNLFLILGIQLLTGIGIEVFGSSIAIKKYLKV
jgi:cell division transport system permease protein